MITLTEAASAKVKAFMKAQERDDLALRVYVKPGGCSGFSYGMGLDEPREDDSIISIDGVRVVVDPQSLRLVEGAIVDYQDAATGAGFAVSNPNLAPSCCCGSSDESEDDDSEGGCGSSCGCGSGGCH